MLSIVEGRQFQSGQGLYRTDENGGKHIHSVQALYEITSVTADSVAYVMVEVLEESGRPSAPHDVMIPTPGKSRGTYTTAGFARAVQRERVILLSDNHVVGRRH